MQPFLKLVPSLVMHASAGLPSELALWLERTLGARRGGTPGCGAMAAEETRDAILRALAQRFYPCVPVSTQAARIQVLADTFAFVNWPRDRERAQIPARYRNRPEEYLWAAFKAGAPIPLPQRELRRILLGAPESNAW